MSGSMFDWWSQCLDMLWRVGFWLYFTIAEDMRHVSFDGSVMDAS